MQCACLDGLPDSYILTLTLILILSPSLILTLTPTLTLTRRPAGQLQHHRRHRARVRPVGFLDPNPNPT